MSLNSVENILDNAESGKEKEKEEVVRKVESVQVWKSDQVFRGRQKTADFMKH